MLPTADIYALLNDVGHEKRTASRQPSARSIVAEMLRK
jgi:hypothetical protein